MSLAIDLSPARMVDFFITFLIDILGSSALGVGQTISASLTVSLAQQLKKKALESFRDRNLE